jgi:hypothetical protein
MASKVMANDEEVSKSKKIFLKFFFVFERDTTNLWGTLLENVKKSKINQPYSTIIIYEVIANPNRKVFIIQQYFKKQKKNILTYSMRQKKAPALKKCRFSLHQFFVVQNNFFAQFITKPCIYVQY